MLSNLSAKIHLNPITTRLPQAALRKLFLVVCAPVHFWAIFMALQDLEWIVGRSTFWDFLGYSAYILLIAFLESLLLTGALLLLALLLPTAWREKTNLALLSAWALAILIASMLCQYYFFLDINPKTSNPYLLRFFDYVHYYDIWLFSALMLAVLSAAALPVLLFRRCPKLTALMLDVVERLNLLAAIFLLLDAAGLLLVIYRNLANLILL